MENERIEIIQEPESDQYLVRCTSKTKNSWFYGFEISEKVIYLDTSGEYWFGSDYLHFCRFRSVEGAEKAYEKYCKGLLPPPPPKVIKVLKGE